MGKGLAMLAMLALLVAGTTGYADQVDEFIKHQMTANHIPGVVIGVVDHGKVRVRRAYGLANIETDAPMTTQGVFELASVTKPFTAMAVMLLVEEGKIRLDDPIRSYLDHTPETWRDITVRELLTHTSGIPEVGWVVRDGSPLLEMTTKQHFDDVAKLPLLFPPGESASYSDSGYLLLGMIIEKVSGQRYRDFMQRRIFGPCDMTSSSIQDWRQIIRHRVAPYTFQEGKLQNSRHSVWQHELPAWFGMLTTVDDLIKWDAALSAGFPLSKRDLEQMWTPATLRSGQPALVDDERYGFGWIVRDLPGHRMIGHPGYMGSIVIRFIDDKLTVIVLTNLDAASGSHLLPLALGIAGRVRPDLAPLFRP